MKNQVPSQIVLGIDSQSLQKFNDEKQIRNGDFKISGIKVSVEREKICGIAIIYQNKANGRNIIFSDTCITGKDITLYEFVIPKDDYIQVIFGHYEMGINQLGFVTYLGKQVIFGVDKGYKFQFMFMGFTFTDCCGTFKPGFLESLSFKVVKLPKQFISLHLFPLLEIMYPNNLNNDFSFNSQNSIQIELQGQQNQDRNLFLQQRDEFQVDFQSDSYISNFKNQQFLMNSLYFTQNISSEIENQNQIHKKKRYITQNNNNQKSILGNNHGFRIINFFRNRKNRQNHGVLGKHHHHHHRHHRHH
ncbi:unnamed protein product [Paramecium sonneborni]|uniref:Jacalin-type lectin domain-containing protein n=1 Tax=Paramecium sonneborni TaxID=65129 RepID=A0A8S1R7G9_9CILI|nr:unnamed protein product [Paramecium sonneborni]